jgi:hypothetical protein
MLKRVSEQGAWGSVGIPELWVEADSGSRVQGALDWALLLFTTGDMAVSQKQSLSTELMFHGVCVGGVCGING